MRPRQSWSASASSFGHGDFCRLSSMVASVFEIHRLFQQLFDLRNPFINPLRVESVNLVGGLQVPQKNVVVHASCHTSR